MHGVYSIEEMEKRCGERNVDNRMQVQLEEDGGDSRLETRGLWPKLHRERHGIKQQEVQLPQRNSASAAHMEGLRPPAHSPPPPLATPMRMVESESHNVRTSSVPSTKRTLK